MSNLSKLEEVEQRFDHLVETGAYAEALELITREAHLFPDYSQKVVYSWRMTMACRLNNRALVLQLLKEAVEAGHWYSDLHDNPDFQLLHGEPEFERLAEICAERRAHEMATAVPMLKTLQPDSQLAPYPLLLALHGANSNVESFASHWSTAVSHGWLVGLPQSSQAFGPGTFSWNDWEWAIQEVRKQYAILCTEYPIDPQRVVLAGFSQGGGLAAWLALSSTIEVRGLILVGPFLTDVKDLIPLMEAHPPHGVWAYLVAGQRDQYCLGVAQRLATLLPQHGIVCELDVYPDLEHSFPPGFESRLPYALEYVLQG
jgi:predicted esterase